VDSSNPWVGIQYGGSSHMTSGADGSIFGHDRLGANEYRDISFGGFGVISDDSIQNGVGAIIFGDSNQVTIELKKPLNSGDSSGNDIEWTVGNLYTIIIRWDSNGGGSSGGSTSHLSGPTKDRVVFLNMDTIPEFPGLTLLVSLITITAIILVLKRKKALKTS